MKDPSQTPADSGNSKPQLNPAGILDYAPPPPAPWYTFPNGVSGLLRTPLPYTVNNIRYSVGGLLIVSSWIIWGGICWNLMQTVFPNLMPLQLDEIHAPNQAMAILQQTIPSLLAFIIVPIISFKSDRYRSKWGRRKPYILVTAPFTVLFLISLAYVKDIYIFMNAHETALMRMHISPMTASMVAISFFICGFMFFDDFVCSVGYYLIADVIPTEVMGKFNAISGMIGVPVGMFWNTFVYPYSLTHTKLIYAGMGLLYFFGYGLMCLMVKEGKYPPVDPEEKRANRWEQFIAFFRESFTHPLYLSMFLFNGAWAMTNACSIYTIFFRTKTLGLSLTQLGRIGTICAPISFIVMLPIGVLVDLITPLRALIIATILVIPVVAAGYCIHGYDGLLVVSLVSVPVLTFWDATTPPMLMQMLPRKKYGQFCAANSMFRSLVRIVSANIGAVYLTYIAHNDYRKIGYWQVGWMFPAFALLLYVYYQYKKHGGPHHYVAPVPSIHGGEEPTEEALEVASDGAINSGAGQTESQEDAAK